MTCPCCGSARVRVMVRGDELTDQWGTASVHACLDCEDRWCA
ncbi:hypothetical protein [Halomarina oriensis]|nr:hypothetical protein [Halomarina oriensis]